MESNEELARQYETLKLTGKELEGLVPVKAQIKPDADVIYSIRFTRDEMDRIGEFVKAHKMKVSSFIRQVTLAAIEDERNLSDAEKVNVVKEVREHAKALAEAADRL
jgi:uncharacterized UPF0146 family protein